MEELIICKRDAFAFLTRRGSNRFRDIPKLNFAVSPKLMMERIRVQDQTSIQREA